LATTSRSVVGRSDDSGVHVLDDDHRLHRIHDRKYATAAMSTLTLSRVMIPVTGSHRDDAQRHLHQPVDDRDDEPQAGFPDTMTRPSLNHTPSRTGSLPNGQRHTISATMITAMTTATTFMSSLKDEIRGQSCSAPPPQDNRGAGYPRNLDYLFHHALRHHAHKCQRSLPLPRLVDSVERWSKSLAAHDVGRKAR